VGRPAFSSPRLGGLLWVYYLKGGTDLNGEVLWELTSRGDGLAGATLVDRCASRPKAEIGP
jgi:hypothetical protein